jgi:hypothetical protein
VKKPRRFATPGQNVKISTVRVSSNEELRELAKKTVALRNRCRTDRMFLANEILGFDFQPCHQELFDVYPPFDPKKSWVEQNPCKNIMVLHSRGHFKSTAIVVVLVQAIICNPDIRILLMQGNLKVTRILMQQIKAHFLGEALGSRFKELFPEFCSNKKGLGAEPNTQFTTPARKKKQIPQATVTCASSKSIKTGQHYDLLVADDIQNELNYKSPHLLQGVLEDFTNCLPLLDPGCPRWVSGTRWSHGDVYDQILRWSAESDKWTISVRTCWTEETKDLPDPDKVVRFPRFTKKDGQLGGFLKEDLLQMQRDDPQFFACQFLMMPMHSTQQAFTKEMFYNNALPAHEAPSLNQAIFMCDLASTNTEHSDDNVILCGKTDSSGLGYLVDMRGGQWTPTEMAINVIDLSLIHRPAKILLEKSGAGVFFADVLRLVAKEKSIFLPIDFVRVDTKPDAKNMRVVSFSGVLKRNKFKFFLGLSNFDKLVEQAITFPKSRHGHDDYPDCLALLYGELSKELLQQPVRPRPTGSPIFQLIEDRQTFLGKVLREREMAESQEEVTGLE